jgi:predicted MPP superfamily phosphohydrolase
MQRFLVFCIFLLVIDLVAYQPIQLAMSELDFWVQLPITILYWSVLPLFVLWFLWHKNNTAKSSGRYRMQRSIFYLVYFAKFVLILFALIGQLGALFGALITYLIPSFVFPENSLFYAQIISLLTTFVLLLLIYGILWNRHRYTLYQVEVPIADLPANLEGLKIVQISDIHSGSFTDREPLKRGIELINKQQPDLVFFTGDLVNTYAKEVAPYVEIFEKIRAKYGVFSVLGNHDYGDYAGWPSAEAKINNLNQLKTTQKQMGWQLLLNENRLLNILGSQIAVIGVENYSASPRFSKYGNLEKAYRGSQHADLKLLLSHDPSHWDDQVNRHFKDIAITFSGHTHGAQFGIEIAGFFKWSPVQYVYKQWAGLYQKGKQFLYVNRGFGYLAYPGRVGILPEITLVRLTKKY